MAVRIIIKCLAVSPAFGSSVECEIQIQAIKKFRFPFSSI